MNLSNFIKFHFQILPMIIVNGLLHNSFNFVIYVQEP